MYTLPQTDGVQHQQLDGIVKIMLGRESAVVTPERIKQLGSISSSSKVNLPLLTGVYQVCAYLKAHHGGQLLARTLPGLPAAPEQYRRDGGMTGKKNTLKMPPPSRRHLPVTLASPSEPTGRNLHPRLLDAAVSSTAEMGGAEESLSPMKHRRRG